MQFKVGKMELVNHGITGSQYFQGCGTSFTEFDHVATGCGDDFAEALNDAIDMMASYGVPNGKPLSVERDGQNYVNPEAYDSFDVDPVLDRICKLNNLNPNNLPDKPSANAQMLEANGYDEDATFDEEEPERSDYDSDEAFDEAYSDYQNRESEWEESQEELLESLNEDADVFYYVSIRWNKADDSLLEQGICPGCGEQILGPDDYYEEFQDGESCENCLYKLKPKKDQSEC